MKIVEEIMREFLYHHGVKEDEIVAAHLELSVDVEDECASFTYGLKRGWEDADLLILREQLTLFIKSLCDFDFDSDNPYFREMFLGTIIFLEDKYIEIDCDYNSPGDIYFWNTVKNKLPEDYNL